MKVGGCASVKEINKVVAEFNVLSGEGGLLIIFNFSGISCITGSAGRRAFANNSLTIFL
jgi:hypothetical protein